MLLLVDQLMFCHVRLHVVKKFRHFVDGLVHWTQYIDPLALMAVLVAVGIIKVSLIILNSSSLFFFVFSLSVN